MSSTREQAVYDRLPEALQTLSLDIWGLANRRRMSRFQSVIDLLRPTESWTPDEQRRFVANQLCDVLRHALVSVPRYRSLRHLLADLTAELQDLEEILQEFPVVSREEIAADPQAFRSSDPQVLVRRVMTSGTTGSPLTVWLDNLTLTVGDALGWRRTMWAGYEPGDWIARLVGDRVVPLSQPHPARPFRLSRTDRRLYLSAYHLDRGAATAMTQELVRLRPAFLMGYPSALDALACLTGDSVDLSAWKPKAVLFSSEPLLEHQRRNIEGWAGAPLRGFYGSAERVVSAAQCEHGNYHLSLVDGYIEGQFSGINPGTAPRLTSLLNRAMPLIRYELGDDLRIVQREACPCGRTLPLIDPVLTKLEDCVTTPTGRRISASILTWAFKDLPGLYSSQIVQKDDRTVEVLFTARQGDSNNIRGHLLPRLDEMLFGEIDIRFTQVEKLAVTEAGKSRFVVDARGPRDRAVRA